MKRSTRLAPVLKVADLEAKKAARAVAFMHQRLEAEQQKLQQLQQYQREYHNKMVQDGRTGISVSRLQMVSRFSSSIEQAMVQQGQQIETVRQQYEDVRSQWRERDLRHRQLEKMLERIRRVETGQQQRQEQRNHDEYARRGVRKIWD